MNQVSGIDLHLIGGIVCIICVFYTLVRFYLKLLNEHRKKLIQTFQVGGIKAVVHTDAWQICIMFVSVVVVTIIGTWNIGGPAKVFEKAFEGGRIDFFK